MHWQDIVLSAGQIIFTVSLLPTVLGRDKPAFSTSLITGIVLTIFIFTQITLSLYFTAAGTTTTAALWLIIAYQKYSIDKRKI